MRELLHYDPETGHFTWVSRAPYSGAKIGFIAGRLHKADGYWGIGVDGFWHHAHRLAWFYVHGKWPAQQIDHINGVRTDNRIANLRDVPPKTNSENQRRVVGASWEKVERKWRAQIKIDGKQVTLGRFDTLDEARQAYVEAKRRHHAGCTI